MGPQSEISTPKALEKIWDRKEKSFQDKKKKRGGHDLEREKVGTVERRKSRDKCCKSIIISKNERKNMIV